MNREELLCRLARDYAENEGARLHEELNAIKAPPPSPGLDKRVRRGIFRLKYKVHMRVAGTLAACLALALVLPLMLQQQAMPGALAPQPQMAAPAAPAPAAEEFSEEMVVAFDGDFAAARIYGEFDAETAPAPRPPMAGGGMEEFGDRYQLSEGTPLPPEGWADSPALPEVELRMLIPLGFALPEGFYQESSTARGGRSSHFLRSQNDDIIMLMVIQDVYAPYEFIGYTPMQLGDYTIYYRYDVYQNAVAFQVGSTVYSLSGAAPMEDFILLSEAIIAG